MHLRALRAFCKRAVHSACRRHCPWLYTHVPPPGRDLIRKTLHDAGVTFTWYEVAHAQHAFIRDELSKGRYDPAIAGICFQMLLELFGRVLRSDLGPSQAAGEPEHVC